MKYKNSYSGFSLVEVILAMAIFVLFISALGVISTSSVVGNQTGAQRSQVHAFVNEGYEAVLAVQNQGWNYLLATSTGVRLNGSAWELKGEEDIRNGMVRTVSIQEVCRNGADQIIVCPGNYTDLHTWYVSTTVAWNPSSFSTNTLSTGAYISNWDSQDWIQTDWSGGDGQAIFMDEEQFESASSINVGVVGEIGLEEVVGNATGTWQFASGELLTHSLFDDFDDGTFANTQLSGIGQDISIGLIDEVQWVEDPDSQVPTTERLFAVSAIDEDYVWAVGRSGKILKYNGNQWLEYVDIGTTQLNTILGLSTSSAWSVGNSGKIYEFDGVDWNEVQDTGGMNWWGIDMTTTTDGFLVGNQGKIYRYDGNTWSQFQDTGNHNWFSVDMIDEDAGWMSGNSGKIYRYDGNSWTEFQDTGTMAWRDIHMFDNSSGWAVGNQGKFYRYDGNTWTQFMDTGNHTWFSVNFTDPSNGIAVASSGEVRIYDGNAWEELDIGTGTTLYGVDLLDADNGWIVGNNGKIFTYTQAYAQSGTYLSEVFDSGATTSTWDYLYWSEMLTAGSDIIFETRTGNTQVPDGSWSNFQGNYSDPQVSNIISPDGRYLQYRTTFTVGDDYSQTPVLNNVNVLYNAITSEDFVVVDIVDKNNVWAVTQNGTVFFSDGNIWLEQADLPGANQIYGLDMASDSLGWAVGNSGKVYQYNGNSWFEFLDTGNNTWRDVQAIGQSDAWMVREGGKIFRFDGNTWNQHTDTGGQTWYAIDVFDQNDGFVVGNGGRIARYNGVTWVQSQDVGGMTFYDIDMIDENFGVAVADQGKIYQFDGNSWVQALDTGNQVWKGVDCFSEDYCWVSGNNGEVYYYNGTDWTGQDSLGSSNLEGISLSESLGYIVGENGAMYELEREQGGFPLSGELISSAFNMNDSSPVQIIDWEQNLGGCNECAIEFALRGAQDDGGNPGVWTDWMGPDGVGTSFVTSTGSLVPVELNGNQWMQYKVILTGDGESTPVLTQVRINYK